MPPAMHFHPCMKKGPHCTMQGSEKKGKEKRDEREEKECGDSVIELPVACVGWC